MKVSTKFFQKNAFIYLEGKNNSREFYIIKSGQVRINRKNPILGDSEDIKSIGFIFGIIQSITGIADDEVVQAITDCELFVISKDKIAELYTDHPKIILKILSEYSEILRRLDKDLTTYDFFTSYSNRREKTFEISDKYINLKFLEKAAHLLKSAEEEFKNIPEIHKKISEKLKSLPSVDFYKPSQIISYRKYSKGAIVFTEYEQGDCFFIIRRGKVRITKLKHDKESLLAILNEGDLFGEMAILNNKPRNATAMCEDDTDLMVVKKDGIGTLPPPLFVKILEFLTKRIWFVQQQIICHKLPIPTAKLYYILVAKIKQLFPDPRREYDKSYTFKFPIDEFYLMLDFDDKAKNEILDFLNDRNIELYNDSIRIRNIGDLLDKNSYNFSRALYIYNGIIDKK